MARPQKQTADYFPHYATHGKTMFVLEQRYGVAGYAAWFKLLELLCTTPGHCYYAITEAETEFIVAKMGFTDTETWLKYMETLKSLGAIDNEIWVSARGVWCQNLVDNLATMYNKRVDGVVPTKPMPTQQVVGQLFGGENIVITTENQVNAPENPVNGADNAQSKVKETKVNNTKANDIGGGDCPFTIDGKVMFKVTWAFWNDIKSEFADVNPDSQVASFMLYWFAGKRKLKNPKLALRNWMLKAREIKDRGGNNSHGRAPLPNTEQLRREFNRE